MHACSALLMYQEMLLFFFSLIPDEYDGKNQIACYYNVNHDTYILIHVYICPRKRQGKTEDYHKIRKQIWEMIAASMSVYFNFQISIHPFKNCIESRTTLLLIR